MKNAASLGVRIAALLTLLTCNLYHCNRTSSEQKAGPMAARML